MAELLRCCKLRAGISRAQGVDRYVLGNPKAWLGVAYHYALLKAADHVDKSAELAASEAWEAAIAREYQRSKQHPLDRRFGAPEAWPRYYLAAAMAKARAAQLFAPGGARHGGHNGGHAHRAALREQWFTAAHGKLRGRPDVVGQGEILDFKSGSIYHEEDHEQIKDSHIRQLRLYAFLVNEALGWWPSRGILLPMTGSPVEVALLPAECEGEAAEAIRLLDEYNAAVATMPDPAVLADPSPANCGWCAYQMLCPAFWSSVGPAWQADLPAGALTGAVEGSPLPVYGDQAVSLTLRVHSGTTAVHQLMSLSPIDTVVHPSAGSVVSGDGVRAIGLPKRPDGAVHVGRRTVFDVITRLPSLVVSKDNPVGAAHAA